MKIIFTLSLILLGLQCHAQSPKEEAYRVLGELVGGVWTYEGKWSSGESFKQEIKFYWGLDQHIIKLQTYGVINQDTKAYGLRNEGIRAWDASLGKMKFIEFDVFGGVTEGYCVFEADQFHYEYQYEVEGQMHTFRDTWRKIDNDSYEFSVKMKIEEGWKTYTTNVYKRITD